MNHDQQEKVELTHLLLSALDNELTAEQNKRLNQLLENPQLRQHYFKLLGVAAGLRKIEWETLILNYELNSENILNTELWKALAESERTCPSVLIEKKQETETQVPLKMLKIRPAPRRISNFQLYFGPSVAAVFLFLILYISFWAPPPVQTVATLTDSINAQWANESSAAAIGTRLKNADGPKFLQKGLIKITFDYGAEVVIEAPAQYELTRPDRMIFHSGRLCARVPEQATGFMVDTQFSSIIDLGTEFGVKVEVDGSTEIQMLKGQASLVPGSAGNKRKGQTISQGQARRVDTTGAIQYVTFKKDSFVRDISSRSGIILREDTLSLADIVGGGNGTGTGKPNQGINPSNGTVVSKNNAGYYTYSSGFTKVTDNPLIDSVFIPNGRSKNIQISSTDLCFSGFPNRDGTCCADITNQRGPIYFMGPKNYSISPLLGGVQYGTDTHPLIYMHSNAGITFDLEAIRSQFNGSVKIKGFRSLCGTPDGIEKYSNTTLDFWVVVDGQEQFRLLHVKPTTPSADINLPLTGSERFLTLVVTDGSDGYQTDLGLFADPRLTVSYE